MPNNTTYDKSNIQSIGEADPAFEQLKDVWSEEKLKLRQNSLRLLMANFGSSSPATAIYECANEWCDKQYTTNGLANYFKAYYTGNKYK
tara:strand:- start:66 stop:332 length:267 start_codon:yes stop_codon:yes gene_type:complete